MAKRKRPKRGTSGVNGNRASVFLSATDRVSSTSTRPLTVRDTKNHNVKNYPEPIKLHLGCGYKVLDGYVNIDLYSPVADLKLNISDLSCFEDSSVEEIYLNAVFEHLYVFEQRKALAEWWRVLKPGGKLIIHSIPDFDEIVRAYLNRAPGNDGLVFDIEEVSRYTHGAYDVENKLGQIHKDVFTKQKMRKLLEGAGFEIASMENVCWGEEPNPVNLNIVAVKTEIPVRSPIDVEDELYSPRPYISTGGRKTSVAAIYCTHDDCTWLLESINSVYEVCQAIYVLVSETPWFGEPGDYMSVIHKLEAFPDESKKVRVIRGSWKCEADQRNAGLEILAKEGFAYCLVIDADEIYDPVDLVRMIRIAEKHPEVDCWHVEMDTYWKSWRFRIDPREQLKPAVLLKVGGVRFTQNRNVSECKHGLIGPDTVICHHLSYARSDEELLRKLATFSHAHELVDSWYENVWKAWDKNHSLCYLHPTHPSAYLRAVLQPYWALPPVLRRRYELEKRDRSEDFQLYEKQIQREHLLSIVVLTRNLLNYTRQCLESIERHTSVPYEVIVVDNGSTDGTTEFLEQWASESNNRHFITNRENLGYAKGNNLGIAKASGQYVVLLNNDVVVTPRWAERLLACAARDDSIGIVGAVTNAVSGPQYVDQALYDKESLAGLDDFALEWARKHYRETIHAVRVVGFCMLIKRAVIQRIGGLHERYGLGNFEDDDFCIRAAIAGFRSVIARDCFVHHYGSRTFAAEGVSYRNLMSRNWELFKEKWGLPKDLPLGMGYDATSMLKQRFDPSVHYVPLPPGSGIVQSATSDKNSFDSATSHSKPLLSLCMIVKNEERCIGQCLESARGVVDEIVIVDTGSTDNTIQIAQGYGARVYHFEWDDNYSNARNEAAKYARGDWILFLDADEVLDAASKHLLRQAAEKPAADAYEILFYNYCTNNSTQPEITHRVCRIYRNRPEYRFEGRVHENIAPSILASGGSIAELDVIVHHYGYRSDIKKERNKQERYLDLLHAELKEKPDDVYVLYHLSAAYCAEGDFTEAIPYLEKLVDLIPVDHVFAPQAYSRLANAYWAVGRNEDALGTTERADRLHLIHPEISFSRGNALLALERYAEAFKAFEDAIELGQQGKWIGDPGTYGYKAKFGMARALVGLGRYGEALELTLQAIGEYPNFAKARELAALLCTEIGDPTQAEVHWMELLKLEPANSFARRRIAQLCEIQGRYSEAAQHYLDIMKNGEESAELHQKAAACYEMVGDLASAEEHYIKAIEVDPKAVEAYNDLGRLYAAKGEIQSALDCFAQAVEIEPDYANAYFNAGDVLYAIGRYVEAAEVYESGLAKDPTRAEGFLALGNCCYKLGAFDAAAVAFRQALSINPEYEEARHNLALTEESLKKNAVA